VAALSAIPYAKFLPLFRREAESSMHLDTRLLPGAAELLKALHRSGKRLALITSKNAAGARRILEHLGIDREFHEVFGDNDRGRVKPDPEPIRIALRTSGLRPQETVMVGDTRADIEAARGAGVAVIAVGSGFEPLANLADADLQVANARALLELLQST
jgi:phosphoglycolate phosphatase